ncbi:hypothetical protein WBG06_06415 [Nocardioides sp. CCNWLW239]|uniref:hypothetical protein n=1 Tax=Nocardioides sp. CCNWLW239 TaxID=3128902 RepID=UPI0030182F37
MALFLDSAVVVVALGTLGAASFLTARKLTDMTEAVRTASPGRPTYTPPVSVVTNVLSAQEDRFETRARAAALTLGKAIAGAHLDPSVPAAQSAWQAALDHYEMAQRILDRDHGPADAVGVVLLAERGEQALKSARRGRGWTPQRTCFFNPFHPLASSLVMVAGGRKAVPVPTCPACAKSVSRGRQPRGILDLTVDNTLRPWFTLDLGVWGATGFGALDPDLLGRLHLGE